MIRFSGEYKVTVLESNNPTYLHSGIYSVRVEGKNTRAVAHFTNPLTGSGTAERLRMLEVFETQGRVICNPLVLCGSCGQEFIAHLPNCDNDGPEVQS